MSTTFHNPINNVSTTVGSAYTAGSHSLVVATGTGAKFGSTFPLIITASQSGSVLSILEVTGKSTDTLTISGAIEGTTDVNLAVGVTIDMRPTALAITEIQSAVNTRAELAGATFTGVVTATNFFTSGSGAGFMVTRRDTGAQAWEFYSLTGSLGVYNFGTTSDALTIDPSTNVVSFNGSGVVLPTLADASAADGTIYLGSDHPDGNSAPRLCRKDSSGNVNVIG